MKSIEQLLAANITVSIGTMITDYNSRSDDDFVKLEHFCLSNGISNWSVTSPCVIGDWSKHRARAVADRKRAIEITSRFGYGEGQHDFGYKYACGANLCTIMHDGSIIGCVLQPDIRYGSLSDGIKAAWEQRQPILMQETECRNCVHLELCRGGCRVSAKESSGSLYGKDRLQCEAIEAYLAKSNPNKAERR